MTANVCAHWHKRLQHPTNWTMKRLAKRKLTPFSLALVNKPPLCEACIFAKAQKRAWRSKGSIVHSIRSPQQTLPGDGTSCDHITSKQPSLMPQVTGSLTHRRCQGVTIFLDHATTFVHASPFEGATCEEIVFGKVEHERTLKNLDILSKVTELMIVDSTQMIFRTVAKPRINRLPTTV